MERNYQKHPFHLVDPSPSPLTASIGAFCWLSGTAMYFHGYVGGFFTLLIGMSLIIYTMCT